MNKFEQTVNTIKEMFPKAYVVVNTEMPSIQVCSFLRGFPVVTAMGKTQSGVWFSGVADVEGETNSFDPFSEEEVFDTFISDLRMTKEAGARWATKKETERILVPKN